MKTTSLVALFSLALCHASSTRGQTLEWVRQLGTVDEDKSRSISTDGLGNVHISGDTDGNLDVSSGFRDAFLSKYAASGTLEWTRQLGTDDVDRSRGVSADGLGNIYIAGDTWGSLEGTNAGRVDAFVSKYDTDGTLEWTRQFGTSGSDRSNDISTDGLGNVYIAGETAGRLGVSFAGDFDAFIRKYDGSGEVQWTRQFGTSGDDRGDGVSADGMGNVYITGRTQGSLEGANAGGHDAFLKKYDANGILEWTRQFGTSSDERGFGISTDGLGNVYISGDTAGNLDGVNAGDSDVYVRKYDGSGEVLWTRQLGTSGFDVGLGALADGLGNVYVNGYTQGNLDGANAGSHDAFLSKYSSSGTLEWTRQLGTRDYEDSEGVSADGLGYVYISGFTDGSLDGANVGGFDAFVAKFKTSPKADFDGDGDMNIDDVDALVGEIVAGTNDSAFDLTSDGFVDIADRDQWLGDAATANGFNAPYLLGDANLDGSVNASDLNDLGQNWLSSPNTWQLGDFTADGTVNAGDLNEIGFNWLQSIPSAAAPESVPEPTAFTLLLGIMATPRLLHRRRSGRNV